MNKQTAKRSKETTRLRIVAKFDCVLFCYCTYEMQRMYRRKETKMKKIAKNKNTNHTNIKFRLLSYRKQRTKERENDNICKWILCTVENHYTHGQTHMKELGYLTKTNKRKIDIDERSVCVCDVTCCTKRCHIILCGLKIKSLGKRKISFEEKIHTFIIFDK